MQDHDGLAVLAVQAVLARYDVDQAPEMARDIIHAVDAARRLADKGRHPSGVASIGFKIVED